MSNCEQKILIQEEELYIGQCPDCKQVGLLFNNIVINFSPENFSRFSKSLNDVSFNKKSLAFPDGVKRVVIDTLQDNIRLTFNEQDFGCLTRAIQQAGVLLEAKAILE